MENTYMTHFIYFHIWKGTLWKTNFIGRNGTRIYTENKYAFPNNMYFVLNNDETIGQKILD